MRAIRHYGKALRFLTELERDEGSERAQSGQAQAFGYLGNHLLAYYLHRATYLERMKCLGEAHIDTLKSRADMEREKARLEKSESM